MGLCITKNLLTQHHMPNDLHDRRAKSHATSHAKSAASSPADNSNAFQLPWRRQACSTALLRYSGGSRSHTVNTHALCSSLHQKSNSVSKDFMIAARSASQAVMLAAISPILVPLIPLSSSAKHLSSSVDHIHSSALL